MLHLLARPLLEMAHVPLPLVLERALTPALAIGAMAYFKIPHPPAAACVAVYATLGDVGQQTPAYFADARALLGCAYSMAMPFEVVAHELRRRSGDTGSPPRTVHTFRDRCDMWQV